MPRVYNNNNLKKIQYPVRSFLWVIEVIDWFDNISSDYHLLYQDLQKTISEWTGWWGTAAEAHIRCCFVR